MLVSASTSGAFRNERSGMFVGPRTEISVDSPTRPAPCLADVNGDGLVNSQDVIHFLNDWADERTQDRSGGRCAADIDHNGVVDTRDFVAFLNLWVVGC